MYVVCVDIRVRHEHLNAFLHATLDNARHTRAESGNHRFDVLQVADDPDHFLLYEAYDGSAAFSAHQQMPHYFRWREAVPPWMAKPRSALKCTSRFYGDEAT